MNFENRESSQDLFLWAASGLIVRAKIASMIFNTLDNEGLECRLGLKFPFDLYKQVESKNIFYIKPELCRHMNEKQFDSEREIEIELLLKPHITCELSKKVSNPEEAKAYILHLSNDLASKNRLSHKEELYTGKPNFQKVIEPLLHTESWLATTVKQYQDPGVVGYSTVWSCVNPTFLSQKGMPSTHFFDSVSDFLKERDESDGAVAKQAIEEVFRTIEKEFRSFTNSDFLKQTEKSITEVFEGIGQAIEDWSKQPLVVSPPSESPIYDTIIRFFSEDDWEFAKLKGEPTLRLSAQGKNAQFTCYAKALEEQHTFIFYSICPLQVPKKKRRIVSELIARINHGLLVGNFEMNFDTGEVYCKTSIDVKGDRLTPALLKTLVYTNVLTLDNYLPSVTAVIEQGTTPEEAIRLVE